MIKICGIAGFHIKDLSVVDDHKALERMADELLLGIQQRGKQATGMVAMRARGKVVMDKSATSADSFIKTRKKIPKGTQTVLLHTRFATQGSVDNYLNNHPVLHDTCFAVHNGIIFNDNSLFDEIGVERSAEVDSEIIAALLVQQPDWNNQETAEALNKIRGSAAIAAIDPIKHPGQLLLARIDGSPLMVLETRNVLVWASTGIAIRDAWKKVFGSDPGHNRIHIVPEGRMYLIEGNNVKEHKFERPFGASGQSGGINGYSRTGWSAATRGPSNYTSSDPLLYAVKLKTKVEEMRASGRGIARLQKDRERYNDEQLRNSNGAIAWHKCYGCSEQVIENDMEKMSVNSGILRCLDCRHAYSLLKYSGIKEKTLTVMFSDKDKKGFTTWGEMEGAAHRETLTQLSYRTGLDSDFIDYIIFRAGKDYLQKHSKMGVLASELDDMYQESLVEVWADLDWNDKEEPKSLVESNSGTHSATQHRAALESTTSDHMCSKHAIIILPGEEECFRCAADREKPEHLVPVAPPRSKCVECKSYVKKGKGCNRKSCKIGKLNTSLGKTSAETPSAPGRVISLRVKKATEKEFDLSKCNQCKDATPVIFISKDSNEPLIGFCNTCYKTCSVQNCIWTNLQLNKNAVEPNHLSPDGKRLCHWHCRGMKGVVSDGTLAIKGYKVKVRT